MLEANMSRGEELNFASQNCDIFISTAPTSTFAFWMAYLMPENRPIFYISKIYPYNSKEMVRQHWISIEGMN
uniref:Glucuronosyltransferase n=3 Tax=Meloidogyne TaxID=189290 RepID=A0A915NU01_9BILA